MIQHLRVLAPLQEDLGQIPDSLHEASQLPITPAPEGLTPSSGLQGKHVIHRHNTYTFKMKINESSKR